MTNARLKHHAGLVDKMAEIRGIDLQEAVIRADLVPDDLSDMVLRCTGCTQPTACAKWLANQSGAVSQTPSYCRNTEAFDELCATVSSDDS